MIGPAGPGDPGPVLMVGHAADRTGPPIYLRHLLRWLTRAHPAVDVEVVLLSGGPLLDELRSLAPVHVVDNHHGAAPPWPMTAAMRRARVADPGLTSWRLWRDRQMRRELRGLGADRFPVVYANTAVSALVPRLLPRRERKVITHVHELEVGMSYHLPPEDRRFLLEGSTHLFAASDAVKQNLVGRHGVAPEHVTRHYEMVDITQAPDVMSADRRAELRQERGIGVDALVVGSAGTTDWRKATDLFVRAAWHLRRSAPDLPLELIWVGGDAAAIERVEADVRAAGLDGVVRFVGQQDDPVTWFGLMDVFVLPAREDAFPLVCLEALSTTCPVVCFDTGGMQELVSQGCGRVARYPDVTELAAHVEELLRDAPLRTELGARGAQLVREHHDVSVRAPALWDDICRWSR